MGPELKMLKSRKTEILMITLNSSIQVFLGSIIFFPFLSFPFCLFSDKWKKINVGVKRKKKKSKILYRTNHYVSVYKMSPEIKNYGENH